MAKLGGTKVQLTDIRKKFALQPGGKVYDLSDKLDFCITGVDDGSGSVNPTEIVSNTLLSFQGAAETVASSSFRPIGFTLTSTGSVVLPDPDSYPSYLKDEQTVLIFLRNEPSSSSDLTGGSIFNPHPCFAPDGGSAPSLDLDAISKYEEVDQVFKMNTSLDVMTGTDTRDSRFFDRALKYQFLETVATISTGSQDVTVVPFFAGGFYQSLATAQQKKVVPSFSYKDVIYDTNSTVQATSQYISRVTGSIIVPSPDNVMLGYDQQSHDSSNIFVAGTVQRNLGNRAVFNGIEDYGSDGASGLVKRDFHPGGLAPMRYPPNFFYERYPNNVSPIGPNSHRPFGNPLPLGAGGLSGPGSKSSNGFHLLAFRQKLASDEDSGYMSLTVDDKTVINHGVGDLPDGSSRFTKLDRKKFYEMCNSTELPSTIRAIGTSPDRMSIGASHDYILIAGWRRILTDDEIQSIRIAMTDGVYESQTTSFSAPVLSMNSSNVLTNHVHEFEVNGVITSLIQESSTNDRSPAFYESDQKVAGSGFTEISIPVVTNVNPHSKGFCFRSHGSTGLGDTRVVGLRQTGFDNQAATKIGQQMIWSVAEPGGTFPTPLIESLYQKTNTGGFSSNYPPQADGNVGTGFLYYSPKNSLWVEKRIDESTAGRSFKPDDSFLSDQETLDKKGIRWSDANLSGSHNILEYRNNTVPSDRQRLTSSFDISGSSRILGQFAGSPNIGYLHPWKESQDVHGYGRIGYPTSVWGAPSDKKYHAFDAETFKMSDFIDRPFIVSEIHLKVDIQACRIFTRMTGSVTSSVSETGPAQIADFAHSDHGQWVKYVMNRRDIENYSFFLYRQRRTGGAVKDSSQDISGSERFLVASASMCFYNSASFGGSYKDGFWVTASSYYDNTQDTSPLYSLLHADSFNKEVFRTIFTSASFGLTSSFNIAPGITASLTLNDSPIHGPAFSHNWGFDFNYRGVGLLERNVNLKMKPGVAPQGFTCPTLMTFVSGVGKHTGKKWDVPVTGVFDDSGNLLFYRPIWNHTGFYERGSFRPANIFSDDGPGTYAYQVVNYWHGGTRVPKIFHTSSVDTSSKIPNLTRNFVRYVGTNLTTVTASDVPYNAVRQISSNNFGKSIFDITPSFSQFTNYDSSESNRITPREDLYSIVVDGRAINCPTINSSKISQTNRPLTTSSSDFYSIIQPGWWQGVAPVPKKIGPEIKDTDYLLLPGDELILGLESSNFAVPDFGPTFMTGVYKEHVSTYLPTSYVRVLPGVGEIRLIGRYLRNDEGYLLQKPSKGDVTTTIGEIPYDQFLVTETDGYYGGIFDEIITGSIFSETSPRGVAGHATAGDIKGNFSLNRIFTVYTDRFVRDYFNDPIRDTLRSTGSLPGSNIQGYRIPQKAVLSSLHYGYLRDFIETPPHQVLAPATKGSSFNTSPVLVKFIEKSSTQFNDVDEFQKSQTSPLSVAGTNTSSQNVSRVARLDGPYKDGEFTGRDEIENVVIV